MSTFTQFYIEHDIPPEIHRQVTDLRNHCFPDHSAPRSYYKQIPHFRYLVFHESRVIGHLGIDHRVMSVAGNPLHIFGLIDFCVDEEFRNQKIASSIIEAVSELARRKKIDFLFLIASNHKMYENNGFRSISADCSYLKIHDHKNYGVGHSKMVEEILIKPIGYDRWPDGEIDLLGYMY